MNNMKYVLVQSSGHNEERLYKVPTELFTKIKAFDKKWGCWSDCDDDSEIDESSGESLLMLEMAPYEITDVLNVCEYA